MMLDPEDRVLTDKGWKLVSHLEDGDVLIACSESGMVTGKNEIVTAPGYGVLEADVIE